MGIKKLFKKKSKYIELTTVEAVSEKILLNEDHRGISEEVTSDENAPSIPEGMWQKCKKCGNILYNKDLDKNFMVCKECDHHMRVDSRKRIEMVTDKGTFVELDKDMISKNPLSYSGYEDKVAAYSEKTGDNEAVITGVGFINGVKTVIGVMNSGFMMGSMGSVVGEKVTRAIEYATENKLPVIMFTASGGARMQEGMFSLMQMAKTSAAVSKHSEAKQLYITVLTDPTTGGVTASFAMQGDIILSEPKALIGFAGKRVIQQTIKQELPDGFQSAEFLLEKGFIDKIIDRRKLKATLGKILRMHVDISAH
ncbi:acetyl-CoA carboxylase, carboxyltransferase subunit beta [Oceanirhabdus seepicola]|uniref:Acetyl-coenzyme A carboxylase carboxyl transferase subunit beta n=1 Tax=Oceanirhabdus seepicola TaxID=2828781 RepID=A0A9J6P8F0_9CLOT|nr:acetyl-CoA carboxylase, carboxyltransferase subunit beta [Oceanirhabdus seepicola]MCM1992302.1 acetyl-CoA carboxylase carboxyltransferase subunit beta [Oceanirhabdus seepicola]